MLDKLACTAELAINENKKVSEATTNKIFGILIHGCNN